MRKFRFRRSFAGSVDGGKGVSGGGILAKQAKGSTAHDESAYDARDTRGEQPAMMDGFITEGIVQIGFELVKIYDWALNTNRFSLPVIGWFTVALQS